MLKTDWFAVFIAAFGVGVVVYQGWSSRNENPVMKKIIYGLIGLTAVLWIMLTVMVLGGVGGV